MADNSFTTQTSQSWLQKIMGGFIGTIIGLILIPICIYGLWYNEGFAVKAYKALNSGASQLVTAAADAVNPSNEKKLIYLTGKVTSEEPAKDEIFGQLGDDVLVIKRHVAMYQWVETQKSTSEDKVGGSTTTTTTYSYNKDWKEEPINSSSFKVTADHKNPDMPLKTGVSVAKPIKLGAFELEEPVTNELEKFYTPFDNVAEVPEEFKKSGNSFYKSESPDSPKIGDLKITFEVVKSQDFSVIGGQENSKLTKFEDSKNDYSILILKPGTVNAKELFKQEEASVGTMTWVFRAVGIIALCVAFMMLTSVLQALAAVLPFLSTMVAAGAFMIALPLALFIGLITIASSWVLHRPIIGIGIILVAVLIKYGFYKLAHSKSNA